MLGGHGNKQVEEQLSSGGSGRCRARNGEAGGGGGGRKGEIPGRQKGTHSPELTHLGVGTTCEESGFRAVELRASHDVHRLS